MMNSEAPQNADRQPVVQTINQAPEAVLLVDLDGVIEVANAAAETLFDTEGSELSGYALNSWFAGEDAAHVTEAVARVVADDPGSRLEEVTADMAGAPYRRVRLSIARMRHRNGLCVVLNRVAGAAPVRAKMPRVAEPNFEPEPPMAAATKPQLAPQSTIFAHEPKPAETMKPAATPRAEAAPEADPAHHAQRHFDAVPVSRPEGPAAAPFTPPVAPGRRDIYAEFESVRDRREREHEIPEISPAKCLQEALRQNRPLADSESVTLSAAVDDGGVRVPLDEEALMTLFRTLVERQIVVTPLYCDAGIRLEPAGSGFVARFSDIGRGLSEQELDKLFRQPDLALGISHTGLVEARTAAGRLGLGFDVETAIEGGTAVVLRYER